MAIGRDRGEKHSMALSRLAAGDVAAMGENHTVPVLQQIVNKDMTFAVFPLMSPGFDYPWYYRFSEVLDAVEQILEVTKFYLVHEFMLSLVNRASISVTSDLSHTWCNCHMPSLIQKIQYSIGH